MPPGSRIMQWELFFQAKGDSEPTRGAWNIYLEKRAQTPRFRVTATLDGSPIPDCVATGDDELVAIETAVRAQDARLADYRAAGGRVQQIAGGDGGRKSLVTRSRMEDVQFTLKRRGLLPPPPPIDGAVQSAPTPLDTGDLEYLVNFEGQLVRCTLGVNPELAQIVTDDGRTWNLVWDLVDAYREEHPEESVRLLGEAGRLRRTAGKPAWIDISQGETAAQSGPPRRGRIDPLLWFDFADQWTGGSALVCRDGNAFDSWYDWDIASPAMRRAVVVTALNYVFEHDADPIVADTLDVPYLRDVYL